MDFKRFLEIALGSSYELETQFVIIEELSLILKREVTVMIEQINKEQRMINNLINKLKANS